MQPRIVLIGADGAGKTSTARQLVASLGLPAKYLYLGVNADASNVMLPTTWLWRKWRRWTGTATNMGRPRSHRTETEKQTRHGTSRRIASSVYRGVRLVNLVAEEIFRQTMASIYRIRGYLVVCDRDYLLDFYAHDVESGKAGSWDRRLHGFFLRWFYPRPHLVILLDAPAIQLVERTDADLDAIETRRQEYFAAAKTVPHFEVIDATADQGRVIDEARRLIVKYSNPATRPE